MRRIAVLDVDASMTRDCRVAPGRRRAIADGEYVCRSVDYFRSYAAGDGMVMPQSRYLQ